MVRVAKNRGPGENWALTVIVGCLKVILALVLLPCPMSNLKQLLMLHVVNETTNVNGWAVARQRGSENCTFLRIVVNRAQ